MGPVQQALKALQAMRVRAAIAELRRRERRDRHDAMCARPSGTAVIAAVAPEHRAEAYEKLLVAKPNASASTRRKWARLAGIAAALLLAFLPAAFAQDAPIPTPPPAADPARITVLAGGLVSLGGGTEAPALSPTARIAVEFPLADARLTPRLHVVADLSALPGDAVNLDDPTTFKALQFTVGVSQPVSERIKAALYAQAGFATRLGTDPAPRDKAPRYWSAGLRFSGEAGWLQLGLGLDQRLGGDLYQPAASVAGAVRLYEQEGGSLKGASVYLIGEAVLGLDLSTRFAGRDGGHGDSVRVGIGVGR